MRPSFTDHNPLVHVVRLAFARILHVPQQRLKVLELALARALIRARLP